MDFVLIPLELLPFATGPDKAPKFEIPTEYDFIQHYYGAPEQTRYWNQFQLTPQGVARVVRAL